MLKNILFYAIERSKKEKNRKNNRERPEG